MAADFFVVPTATYHLMFVLVIVAPTATRRACRGHRSHHILWDHPKGSGLHVLQRGSVEPPARTERPGAFYDGNVLVCRMRVRQGDVSRILMDSKHKGFSGLKSAAAGWAALNAIAFLPDPRVFPLESGPEP